MPNFDRSGPFGAGAMTGKRLGFCTGARGLCPSNGRGRGFGPGRGTGYNSRPHFNQSCGRGLGWFSVGYGTGGKTTAAAEIQDALESRKVFLQTELDKIETLLSEATARNQAQPGLDEQN